MWVTQPGDRPSLAEPTGTGEGGRGCAHREQPHANKGLAASRAGRRACQGDWSFLSRAVFPGEGTPNLSCSISSSFIH